MAEDQQAPSPLEAALDGDHDARARGNSLASAFLDDVEAEFRWDRLLPREIAPEDWKRFEGYVAEIFTALGMDLRTPGTLEVLQPHGVAVHLSATHLCTQMRGVKEDSSKTWTSFWRGSYEDEPAMRQEFLQTLRFSRR